MYVRQEHDRTTDYYSMLIMTAVSDDRRSEANVCYVLARTFTTLDRSMVVIQNVSIGQHTVRRANSYAHSLILCDLNNNMIQVDSVFYLWSGKTRLLL